jgi:RNA polymerase sigma-70 factor, ECF subfamily
MPDKSAPRAALYRRMDEARERFQGVLDRHGAGLLLYARALAADDPEGLVQDAFANLWTQLAAGGRIEHPAAYLATVARNLAARSRRSAAGWPLPDEAWLAPPATTQQNPEAAADAESIESALRGLPDEQREVVILKVWCGLTFDQIGTSLGIPLNTAASRYRYAMQKLAQMECLKP